MKNALMSMGPMGPMALLGDGATDSLTSVIDQIFVIMNKTVK